MLLCSVKDVRFGEEVGDLLGEVLGAGAGKADGGDDASVAAPQPDEPGLSGGRPRELEEPVSISTVTGGMAGHLCVEGLERGGCCGRATTGLRTRQGRAAPGGEGKLL